MTIHTKALISAAILASFGMTACFTSSQDNNDDADAKVPPCEVVQVEGEGGGEYCAWRRQNIIIETGYSCPISFSHRHEYGQDMLVCSRSSMRPPDPVLERIEKVVDFHGETANHTTPGSPSPVVTVDPTCSGVSQDYADALAALDKGCQIDSDCVSVGKVCGLNSCGLTVSASADQSSLDTLSMQHGQLGCSDPMECQGCMDEAPACQAGVCVVVAPSSSRTCAGVVQDLDDVGEQLDTSCSQDADCEMVSFAPCRCARAANASQLPLPNARFLEEYEQMGCSEQGVCQPCVEMAAVCVANTCVAEAPNM